MTLSFAVSDRFREAAADWGENRLLDEEAALEVKAEQALLEIEHLVSGASEVEFEVDAAEGVVFHEPSDDLEAFLERQAAAYGLEPAAVLELHVDLFARAFLEEQRTGDAGSSDDPRPGR